LPASAEENINTPTYEIFDLYRAVAEAELVIFVSWPILQICHEQDNEEEWGGGGRGGQILLK
jgi:hypothetical protein